MLYICYEEHRTHSRKNIVYLLHVLRDTTAVWLCMCILVAVVRNQIACEYMLFVKSFGNFSVDKCRSKRNATITRNKNKK